MHTVHGSGHSAVCRKTQEIGLYTDGVPEASDENENMFGLERMIKALNREPEADPVGILGNVRDAVSNFTGAAEQFDDMTMLCIEYKGRNRV